MISSPGFTAVTSPEGAFEIRGTPPGRYRLKASRGVRSNRERGKRCQGRTANAHASFWSRKCKERISVLEDGNVQEAKTDEAS